MFIYIKKILLCMDILIRGSKEEILNFIKRFVCKNDEKLEKVFKILKNNSARKPMHILKFVGDDMLSLMSSIKDYEIADYLTYSINQ